MRIRWLWLLTLVVMAGLAGSVVRAESECEVPVATTAGLVQGMEDEGTCVWKGIPYAAPPVGERRWRAPEPAEPWEGVREARKFGPRCMQKGIMRAEDLIAESRLSEDCLYLNLWRPHKSGVFPVMVWVHGGAYYGGTGATPIYWGDRLAAAGDLVVVTFNYRLNVFGFFAHPRLREEDEHGSTGSYGTLDQVAALKWVQENIANFGGDPNNVTIFGESAGGWSICTLLATPLTRGLFHRALLQSGGCEQSGPLEEGYAEAEKVAKKLGCKFDDLECLRKVPASIVLRLGSGGMTSGVDAKPRHDGYVLTDTPLNMIRAGNYNKVPFIAGHTRDEFANALRLLPNLKYTKPEEYEAKLITSLGMPPEEAERLVALYPLSGFNHRPVEAYGRMFGADAALACPTYLGLLAAAQQQTDTYYYRFDYDDMNAGKYTGAAHAMEIPFIFGNLDRMPANLLYDKHNLGPAQELSHIMQGYVINFARTGNPNGPGLPEWPQFRPDSRQLMSFDVSLQVENAGIFDERCAFWDQSELQPGDAMSAIGRSVNPK